MSAAFTVRRVPVCEAHRATGRYVEDGTDTWYCPKCLRTVERFAEATLREDREYHRHHDVRMAGCPYCYPGAVA